MLSAAVQFTLSLSRNVETLKLTYIVSNIERKNKIQEDYGRCLSTILRVF